MPLPAILKHVIMRSFPADSEHDKLFDSIGGHSTKETLHLSGVAICGSGLEGIQQYSVLNLPNVLHKYPAVLALVTSKKVLLDVLGGGPFTAQVLGVRALQPESARTIFLAVRKDKLRKGGV